MKRILHLLLVLLLHLSVKAQDSTKAEYVTKLLNDVLSGNKLVNNFSSENLTTLPVGLSKSYGNTTVVLAVDSAKAVANGILLNLFTQIKLPGSNKELSFGGKNILINPSGIDNNSPMRIQLISKHIIKFGNKVKLILPANGKNYIEFDCNGYKSVSLNGIFEFDSCSFTPDEELAKGKKRVNAEFVCNISDLNNILMQISITPFNIKGLGKTAFSVTNATLDFSDYANPSNFVLPEGYNNTFNDEPMLWRGFFLQDLTVYLPPELSKDNLRKKINAHNLIIDESGVSGAFMAENLISIKNGNAGGWKFSVNKIYFELVQNDLKKGGMNGMMAIPFLGNDSLNYDAQISSSNEGMKYNFTITKNSAYTKDCALGSITLDPSSIYKLSVENGKWNPSAVLNGTITFGEGKTKVADVRFEKLALSARAPYIEGGTFALSSSKPIKVVGFDCGIKTLGLSIENSKAKLTCGLYVSMMRKTKDENDKEINTGISGNTEIIASAILNKNQDNIQEWKYDGLEIKKLSIDATFKCFGFNGSIAIYKEDPVYGDGFSGNLSFWVKNVIPDPVSVEVLFGKKDNFKYWFAKVEVPTKIQIGVVTLTQLRGGAYDHVLRKGNDKDATYLPDSTVGLGFMAGVSLTIGSDALVSGTADLEIAFTPDQALKFISFNGSVLIMNNSKKEEEAPLRADLFMYFDNINSKFDASLDVYLNISGVIKGSGKNNLMGKSVFHSEPGQWYFYAGRPSDPLSVEIAGLVDVSSYFMMGSKLENMPPPPSNVLSILGNRNKVLDDNESALSEARGVAFGAQFRASGGFGRDEGFVYAFFDAGGGADVILRNLENAYCEGRSGRLGIDGWFARGQAYAYLQGKIGIRVKVFRKKRSFDIMSVKAAMLLQAQLPNPTWIYGKIAAEFSVLGGLVSGKVNAEFEVGEKCKIQIAGSELGDFEAIGDIQPTDQSTEASVFSTPQVAFNVKIDKTFEMVNVLDEVNKYKVILDDFSVTSDGNKLNSELRWNTQKNVATLKLPEVMPGKKETKILVKIHINKYANNVWAPMKDDDNEIVFETKESKFTTAAAPNYVPEENVDFAYPVNNQYNFYKNEYPQGYVKLKQGMSYLFDNSDNSQSWEYKASFKNESHEKFSTLNYDKNSATINFNIPSDLRTSNTYTMKFIKAPVKTGGIDKNVVVDNADVVTGNTEDSVKTVETSLTSTLADGSSVIYSLPFRCSKYASFGEKLNAMQSWETLYGVEQVSKMSLLGAEFYLSETFDDVELGIDRSEQLVFTQALPNNQWIKSQAMALVYNSYGSYSQITLNRDTSIYGLLPVRSLIMNNSEQTPYDLARPPAKLGGNVRIGYFIGHYCYLDFSELRNKAVACGLNNELTNRLLSGNLNDLYRGTYPIKLYYKLPGINKITTSRTFNIIY